MTKDNQEPQGFIGKELDFAAFLHEIQKEDSQESNEILALEHGVDELQDTIHLPEYVASKQRTSGLDIDAESEILQQAERELEAEEAFDNALIEEEPDDADEAATEEAPESYEASYLKAVEEQKRKNKERSLKANSVRREKQRKQKLLKIEIQRKALAQDAIDLSELIPIESLQMLIEMLTVKFKHLSTRYEELITKHIERLLRRHTPPQLRAMYKAYPQAFIAHPGFMYQASEEFGGGTKYWVTPKLPYVLPQFSEMAILRAHNEQQCIVIDRLIKRLTRTREQLYNMELQIGSRLAHLMPTHTYYNLLKTHPFWFVMLYEKETGLSLGVYEKVYSLQDSPNRRIRSVGHI